MLLAWTLILAVVSQEMPSNSKARVSEPLTAAEKNQLEREPNVEDRIRVYEAASSRIYGSIRNLILRQQFEENVSQSDGPGFLRLVEGPASDA